MSEFVPIDFTPPVEARLGRFALRPLGPDDVAPDCAAVNANIELIRQTRGGNWPQQTMTVAEDLPDLQEHQRQFGAREAFAYTITQAEQPEYVGCLYIYPPNHPFDDTDKTDMPADADAVVSFWVVQEAYDAGVYTEFFGLVHDWLASGWPFRRVFISNKEHPASDTSDGKLDS